MALASANHALVGQPSERSPGWETVDALCRKPISFRDSARLREAGSHYAADRLLVAWETPTPRREDVRSVIALSHEHHSRATLFVGAKPQISHWS